MTTLPRLLFTLAAAAAAAAGDALAQPTVAPSTESVGRARGEDTGNFNIVHSFETGVRFRGSIDGNEAKYRSDVNFGSGLRLLGSSLTVNSKDGHGGLFDEIVLTTQGLGNDPYQSANLRVQRNGLYRYDLLWRLNEYTNPGLASQIGGHLMNTRRQMQDHDFTLFPQASFRILAGFSRNTQTGPGLSTINLFDSLGDQFPFFSDIDRRQTEFRLGAEAQAAGFKFNVLHGWQRFEETTAHQLGSSSPGANPADRVTLGSLRRDEPYSGNSPFWRLFLQNDRQRLYAISARFTYTGTRRGFTFDEAVAGTSRSGAAATRQVLVAGLGRRPLSTGSLTLSLFPSRRWTLTNHTAFHQTGMDGDASYREINNAASTFQIFYFQNLALRTIANQTDASYKANRWLGVFAGYQVSSRRIQSVEAETFSGTTEARRHSQTNRQQAGSAGLRLQPVKALLIVFDSEIGRADRPFLSLSERRYHVLGGRVQYRTGPVNLQAFTRANYNTNSASLFTHSARSRVSGADVSLSPRRWLSLDAGYSKQHLDTLTGLAYFTDDLVESDRSLYISNIHSTYAGVRLAFGKRADLYAAYTRVEDNGDGRPSPTGGSAAGSALAAFRAAQTFPLAYHSPLARFSVRLHDKVRWNIGYQYYGYAEDFLRTQDYRANTGFTSLTWSF